MEQLAEIITHATPSLLCCLPLHRRNWETLNITAGRTREFDMKMGQKKCLTEIKPGKEKLFI